MARPLKFWQIINRFVLQKREVTFRAVLLGMLLGAVLASANVYLAMKVGAFNPGSIPGALIGATTLSAAGSQALILETNIIQTVTSSAANFSGAFFGSIPVAAHYQAIPGYWGLFLYLLMGGMIGISLTILFRRYFIVEEQLPYPSGIAVATTLKTIDDPVHTRHKLRLLILGALLAALVTLLQSPLLGATLPWSVDLTPWLPYPNMSLGFALSPLFLGFGYLMGVRSALGYCLGCLLSWLLVSPWLVAEGIIIKADWQSVAHFMSSPASGLIIGGTLLPMIVGWRALVRAFRALNFRHRSNRQDQDQDQDLPIIVPLVVIVMGVSILAITFNELLSLISLVLIILMASFFGLFAVRTTGETGITPTSLFVWIAIGFLALFLPHEPGLLAFAAGIIAVSVGQAADSMNDLKTGYLIEATPASQQFVAYLGLLAGALSAPFVFLVIVDSYGIFNEQFPVPFGLVAKNIVESVATGGSAFNWDYLGGGILGGMVMVLLKLPALAMGLGMFAPASFGLPVLVGGLCRWLLALKSPKVEDDGVAGFCGLLAGSGVMGVVMAIVNYLAS